MKEILSASSRLAEQSLEQERIPADLKEIPKQYFENLRKSVEDK